MAKQLILDKVYISAAGGEMMTRGLDDNGIYWYLWDEVCHVLLIPSRAKVSIFNNCVYENEQDVFDYAPGKRELFISTDAFVRIVNRNNERANNIIKEVINNESRQNIFEKSELDKRFEKIQTMFDKPGLPNYVDICLEIKDVWYSDDYREVLDKYDETFDKELESAIDVIRYKLSNEEIEYLIGGNENDEIVVELKKENNMLTLEEWVNGKPML